MEDKKCPECGGKLCPNCNGCSECRTCDCN